MGHSSTTQDRNDTESDATTDEGVVIDLTVVSAFAFGITSHQYHRRTWATVQYSTVQYSKSRGRVMMSSVVSQPARYLLQVQKCCRSLKPQASSLKPRIPVLVGCRAVGLRLGQAGLPQFSAGAPPAFRLRLRE